MKITYPTLVSLLALSALSGCKTTAGKPSSQVKADASASPEAALVHAIDVINNPNNISFNYTDAFNAKAQILRNQLEDGTITQVPMGESTEFKYAQNLGLLARAYSNYVAVGSIPKDGLLTTISSDLANTVNSRRSAVERWAALRVVNHGAFSVVLYSKAFFTQSSQEVRSLKNIDKILAKLNLTPDDKLFTHTFEFYGDSYNAIAIPTNKVSQATILALDLSTDAAVLKAVSDLGISSFEKAFPLVPSIRVGFENQPKTIERSLWYAELSNEPAAVMEPNSCDRPVPVTQGAYTLRAPIASAVEVQKAIYTGSNKSGFAAMFNVNAASSKLSFDPTPNRSWKVDFASFNLSRSETTNEAHDGFAELLDKGYAAAAKGMVCRALPWTSGAVRQVLIADKWVEVLKPGFDEAVDQSRSGAIFDRKTKGEMKDDE